MTARPIRVVLDTTAIATYLAGSEHVGEVLAEVGDEPAAFGLPVNCLAKAAADDHGGLVTLLTSHPAAVVLPMPHGGMAGARRDGRAAAARDTGIRAGRGGGAWGVDRHR